MSVTDRVFHPVSCQGATGEAVGKIRPFSLWCIGPICARIPRFRCVCYIIPEFSVYVAREYRGRGAGRAVLAALIEATTAAGLHKLTSRVFPENAASRAVLKGLGFAEIGIHRRDGRLDGLWRDCVIVERLLEAGDGEHKG